MKHISVVFLMNSDLSIFLCVYFPNDFCLTWNDIHCWYRTVWSLIDSVSSLYTWIMTIFSSGKQCKWHLTICHLFGICWNFSNTFTLIFVMKFIIHYVLGLLYMCFRKLFFSEIIKIFTYILFAVYVLSFFLLCFICIIWETVFCLFYIDN